jgi:hypothetical protein
MLNGVPTEIASYGLESNVQQGVTYNITALVNGNILTLYVNENQVLRIADSSFGSGAFGIRTYESSIQTLGVCNTDYHGFVSKLVHRALFRLEKFPFIFSD